jgi:hypothetical protein
VVGIGEVRWTSTQDLEVELQHRQQKTRRTSEDSDTIIGRYGVSILSFLPETDSSCFRSHWRSVQGQTERFPTGAHVVVMAPAAFTHRHPTSAKRVSNFYIASPH